MGGLNHSPLGFGTLRHEQRVTKHLHTEGELKLRFVGSHGNTVEATQGYVTSGMVIQFTIGSDDQVQITGGL